MTGLRLIDEKLNKFIGLPYLKLARERAIHERFAYCVAVLDKLGIVRPSVIDVGCGSGILLRHLETYSRGVSSYIGIDRRGARLNGRHCPKGIEVRFLDLDLDSDWNFPDNDVAWCSEVIEHLMDDHGVMGRIAASVKRGGHVLVTMPSLTYLQRVGKTQPDLLEVSKVQDGGHVRVGYSRESLRALAEGAGLEVLQIDAVSPRTDFEIKNNYHGRPFMKQVIDRIPLSGRSAFFFNADDEALSHYYSIAAVLRRPS